MRITSTLCLLLCLGFFAVKGQNWNAFTSGRTYHYKSDTAVALPDQSIHFDSIDVLGADSGFDVARRFVFPVDTSLRNQPMFCGREITARSDGSYYFKNPIKVALPTLAALGTQFTLDSISGLTATVSRVGQMNVLGAALDSVKVYTTQALDSLVLSKAHGILEWPASLGGARYRLSGIQELGAGELLPGFDGFMTLTAGADYYYESEYTEGDLIEQGSAFRVRFHVDTALRVGSGLHIAYHAIVRETARMGGTITGITVTQPSGSFTLQDLPNSIMTKSHTEQLRAPGALLGLDMPLPWVTFRRAAPVDTSLRVWDGLWSTMTYEMNGTAKELHFGRSNGATGWLYRNISGDTCARSEMDQMRTVFREGFGVVHAEWAATFSSGTFDMVGAIVNGDTTGSVITDGELLAAAEGEKATLRWAVAPNPASDHLDVAWSEAKAGELQLFDLAGKLVSEQSVRGFGAMVDVRDLPAGMYMLTLTQGEARATKRVVVAR